MIIEEKVIFILIIFYVFNILLISLRLYGSDVFSERLLYNNNRQPWISGSSPPRNPFRLPRYPGPMTNGARFQSRVLGF
jgi:hypothetical protein